MRTPKRRSNRSVRRSTPRRSAARPTRRGSPPKRRLFVKKTLKANYRVSGSRDSGFMQHNGLQVSGISIGKNIPIPKRTKIPYWSITNAFNGFVKTGTYERDTDIDGHTLVSGQFIVSSTLATVCHGAEFLVSTLGDDIRFGSIPLLNSLPSIRPTGGKITTTGSNTYPVEADDTPKTVALKVNSVTGEIVLTNFMGTPVQFTLKMYKCKTNAQQDTPTGVVKKQLEKYLPPNTALGDIVKSDVGDVTREYGAVRDFDYSTGSTGQNTLACYYGSVIRYDNVYEVYKAVFSKRVLLEPGGTHKFRYRINYNRTITSDYIQNACIQGSSQGTLKNWTYYFCVENVKGTVVDALKFQRKDLGLNNDFTEAPTLSPIKIGYIGTKTYNLCAPPTSSNVAFDYMSSLVPSAAIVRRSVNDPNLGDTTGDIIETVDDTDGVRNLGNTGVAGYGDTRAG